MSDEELIRLYCQTLSDIEDEADGLTVRERVVLKQIRTQLAWAADHRNAETLAHKCKSLQQGAKAWKARLTSAEQESMRAIANAIRSIVRRWREKP